VPVLGRVGTTLAETLSNSAELAERSAPPLAPLSPLRSEIYTLFQPSDPVSCATYPHTASFCLVVRHSQL
jgi:hypothetical protein